MSLLVSVSIWLYHRILKLYPASFRELYADEMEEIFRHALAESDPRYAHHLMLLLLREVRDLPVGLLIAYRRQVGLSLSLQGARISANQLAQFPARFERVAIRLCPWVWGLVAAVVMLAGLPIVWMLTDGLIHNSQTVPILKGTSAIILEHNQSYVRLPQESFTCEVVDGKNQAHCTADVADEVLQLTLTIHAPEETGGYSGHCRGIYAEELVHCHQLPMRAKDRTMPPVLVDRPRALVGTQWQKLVGEYAFTFPSANKWLQWGMAVNLLLSVAVAFVIWSARLSSLRAYKRDNLWLKRIVVLLRQFVLSVIAGSVFCFAMAWTLLLLSLSLEDWIERF